MALAPEDIKIHLSNPSLTEGMGGTQPDPNDSLGGFVATTEIVDATLHNLFDVITGDENAAEAVDYRCLFVRNSSNTNVLVDAKLWVAGQVAGGADAAIGLDPAGAVAEDSDTAQAAVAADENTAPSGVVFSTPTTKADGLSVGDLAPGEVCAVWVRRTATDSAAFDLDGVTIRVEGDTGE